MKRTQYSDVSVIDQMVLDWNFVGHRVHTACIDDATNVSAIIFRILQNTPNLSNQLGWNFQGWFYIVQANFFDNFSSISPLAWKKLLKN